MENGRFESQRRTKIFSSTPVDSELKVHCGLYNSKASFILTINAGWERVGKDFSVYTVICQWLRCPIADMHDKVRSEPVGLSVRLSTTPTRNPFIALCSLGPFLTWKNWIIYKWRGQVSVVNSIGILLLSLVVIIFSSSVMDRGWMLGDYSTINISSGHQFHFLRNTWLFHTAALFIHSLLCQPHCCFRQK